MKNSIVFLFILSLFFVYAKGAEAQTAFNENFNLMLAQTNSSDLKVSSEPAAAKQQRPPIERAHVVEDYLPILGKKMREQGMTPPKPFFVTAIYYHMEIPQEITNAQGWSNDKTNPLYAITHDGDTLVPVKVIMEDAKIETNSVGLRAGVNVLPFLQIFGVYIHTEGSTQFKATAPTDDRLLDLGFHGYTMKQKIDFAADTGAIGAMLTYGFRLGRVLPFGSIGGNYAWSFTDRTSDVIETLILSASVGFNVPLPKRMSAAVWLGTQYQLMMGMMGSKVNGSYTATLPPGTIDAQGNDTIKVTSQYSADAKYASDWAMTAGAAFSPTRYFSVVLQFGFLSRFTSMVALQANF